MVKLFDLAKMTTATTGTGTITLGSAFAGFKTFAAAGVANTDVVRYVILDGANTEIGYGTYTSSGTTLTRNVTGSTNSDTAINLSGTAVVILTASALDFVPSTILDSIGSTRGSVLYRGASAWSALTPGTAGYVLASAGAGADPLYVLPKGQIVGIIENNQTSGTNGGTFTSGADQTRVLNTIVYNLNSIVSLSSNQITVPAGTWEISWSAPAVAVNRHLSWLYNITGSSVTKYGSSEFTSATLAGTPVCTRSFGSTVITVGSSNTFEIRHRCETTSTTVGFGVASSLGTEVYSQVSIRAA